MDVSDKIGALELEEPLLRSPDDGALEASSTDVTRTQTACSGPVTIVPRPCGPC